MRNKLTVSIIIILGLGLLGLGIFQLYRHFTKGNLVIDSVPNDLTLTLNGQKIAPVGSLYLAPGDYTLKAVRSGFADQTKTITAMAGQKQTLKFYLAPNGPEGVQWLKDHPDQALKNESVGGLEHQAATNQATEQNPLIKKLPFIGAGFEFRIDYGSAQPGTKFPDQPIIYIEAGSDQAKQDALSWIREQGFNPDNMNIVFTNSAPQQ